VTPAAKAFSDALGEGSRVILRLLLITNLATALGLIALALLRTHKLLAQRHAFADALQQEKERAQITLESIGDGVITTDVDGAITYMNPAAEALTHWQASRHRVCPWRHCSACWTTMPVRRFHVDRTHRQRPAQRWQRALENHPAPGRQHGLGHPGGAPIRSAGKVSGGGAGAA
jgi:PAS domain-containing protein